MSTIYVSDKFRLKQLTSRREALEYLEEPDVIQIPVYLCVFPHNGM